MRLEFYPGGIAGLRVLLLLLALVVISGCMTVPLDFPEHHAADPRTGETQSHTPSNPLSDSTTDSVLVRLKKHPASLSESMSHMTDHSEGTTEPHPTHEKMEYTCPMHPEVRQPQPGNCPKCGMKLEKEKP